MRHPRIVMLILLALGALVIVCLAPGPSPHTSPTAAGTGDPQPVVGADDPVIIAAGDIAACGASHTGDEATAALLAGIAGTVLPLGDNAYPDGTSGQFADCYDPSWGASKARTRPVPGNHDYHTAGASGYFGYFGAAAGDPSKGYYSFDLGTWHLIALNSECAEIGGCDTGSPQETWLKADLAASQTGNILAYWHKPRFSSRGDQDSLQAIWNDLYDYGADVVLAGHTHLYERFAPLDSAGQPDATYGIREFVVGTGGAGHASYAPVANVEVQNDDAFGVLKLTLRPASYAWTFVPEEGKTFTDSGRSPTHGAPSAPTAAPAPTPTPVAIRFLKKADGGMDAFNTDPSWQPTINDRYAGMVMYPPYSDRFTFYAGEGFFYLDAYAVYVSPGRNDTGTSIQHILRDRSGEPCYIPWGGPTAGHPYPQYAADVGNPAFRDIMVSFITQKLATNPLYDGVYLDDVNLDLEAVSCSGGPIDPRTGQVMTNQDWKRYLVEFLEQVRSATAKKVAHNTVWYLTALDDPYLIREIKATDYIEMEQGFVDHGLTSGTGKFSWLKKMQFADLVHSLGASLLDQDEDIRDTAGQKYGLANYLLFSNGTDFYSTFYEANPDQPWTVYEADLGAALGPRYSWNGLWRRDFERGFALVNPLGGSTRSANLGATHSDPWGGSFSSITLNARQGTVVLTR